MPSLLAVVALLPLAQLANSQPTISFPFNAQLPLAARIDEFFSYSFSPYTFQSDANISYSLGNHPNWLSIDSERRRLFGTPTDGDVPPGEVVGQTVDLIATDDKGSISMNATVVVSRDPAPRVQIPLEKQIQNFGNFSAPSSILSYPSTSFSFSFDRSTFGKSGLNYYAVCGDSSPLPAWIQFDASSLTFSGKTPPLESLIQPPHAFDFSLVASDIIGFSASSLTFSIVVGSHKLTTDVPIVVLNATHGSEVIYDGLEDGIKLDGNRVDPSDLTVDVKGLPSWLSFDKTSWKLHGIPRNGDRAANFTVAFKDNFSDNLDVLIVVNVATGLFQSTIEDLQVRPGSELGLDLAKYFRNPSDVLVTVSTDPNQHWLELKGLKLSGRVPKSSKGSFKLFLKASSTSSSLAEDETVNVSFLTVDGATTIGTPTSTAGFSATSSASASVTETGDIAVNEAQKQSAHLSTGQILAATIIPVLFVAVVLLILVCFFRRRRGKSNYLGSSYRSNISYPAPSSLGVNGSVPSMREAVSRGGGDLTQTNTLASKPTKASSVNDDSDILSRRRSSETLGDLSTSDMPHSAMVDAARITTIRNVSNVNSEDGRQSWVTVEGGNGGLAESDRSSQSQRSDITYPESTRQALPGLDYASYKRDQGLKITLPPLGELPSLQPTPLFAYKSSRPPGSLDSANRQSGVTSSSAALPHLNEDASFASEPLTRWDTSSTAREPWDPNWVTLAESEASGSAAPELKRPAAAALEASRDVGSSSDKSIATDISFASSENWKILGPRSPTKTEHSYKDLNDESPYHPSRPGTANAGGGSDEDRAANSELASAPHRRGHARSPLTPQQLGPSEASTPKGGVSEQDVHMSGGRGQGADDENDWIRDHSGIVSEGSFTAFL